LIPYSFDEDGTVPTADFDGSAFAELANVRGNGALADTKVGTNVPLGWLITEPLDVRNDEGDHLDHDDSVFFFKYRTESCTLQLPLHEHMR
jgi:hypothetical protein